MVDNGIELSTEMSDMSGQEIECVSRYDTRLDRVDYPLDTAYHHQGASCEFFFYLETRKTYLTF
jgi:hypothetical protein